MGNVIDEVQVAIIKLKKDGSILIQGQHPKFKLYEKIFIGKPAWSTFQVHLPNGTYVNENYKSLNMGRYNCRVWANSYANENTKITIPKDKPNERLQEILMLNNFFGTFNNFVESFMGLGIGATLVNLDKWFADEEGSIIKGDSEVKIQQIKGQRVIPITVDDGVVTECAFISYKTGGCKLVIHWLNDKGNYQISELVGKGTNGNYQFDYDNINTLDTLSDIPLFQVWNPNITDDDDLDGIGTAITDKAFDSLLQCDVAYTALFKEIKLGQKVKFISTDMLQVDEKGNKLPPYDINDESIIALENMTGDTAGAMQEFNGELRIQQLVSALEFHMNTAAMLCGLGQNQFEFNGGGRPLQTATAVIAKQTEFYRNVVKQENFATGQFKRLVKAIAYVNDTFTNNAPIGELKFTDIQVMFDDNIVEDTDSKKKQALQEVATGTMSLAEYRAAYFDEDYDSALKFLQENAMLINIYLPALQAGAMTPNKFVDLVYGVNVEGKDELVAYIEEQIASATQQEPFADYQDEADNNEEEQQEEEGADA